MDTILFLLYPLKGPHFSSFRIARLLQQRHYNIVYISPAGFRDFIEKQGYEFCAFQENMPEPGDDPSALLDRYFELIEQVHSKDDALFRWVNKLISCYQPAGVIIDSDLVGFSLPFYANNIPVVFINDDLQTDRSSKAPPFFSSEIPRDTAVSRLAIALLWQKWLLVNRIRYLKQWLSSRGKKDVYQKRLARICNFPLKKFVAYDRANFYRLNNFPEFFLYPKELDFPRSFLPNQFHIGAMIDIDRREQRFNSSAFHNGRPVVFCCLGTLSEHYVAQIDKFYLKVIQVFERLPQLNLVIAVGSAIHNKSLRSSGANIFIYESVPQLQLLSKASLMINHGGFNSVKECIFFGVPMLCYPLAFDNNQPGTAARIVYHNLGKTGSIKDSISGITHSVLEVLGNSLYKEEMQKMQAVFSAYHENEDKHVDLLETYLKVNKKVTQLT